MYMNELFICKGETKYLKCMTMWIPEYHLKWE